MAHIILTERDHHLQSALSACIKRSGLPQIGTDYFVFNPYLNAVGQNISKDVVIKRTRSLLSTVIQKKELHDNEIDQYYIRAEKVDEVVNIELLKIQNEKVVLQVSIDLSNQSGRRFFERLESFRAETAETIPANQYYEEPSKIALLFCGSDTVFNLKKLTQIPPLNLAKPPFYIRIFRDIIAKLFKRKHSESHYDKSTSMDAIFSDSIVNESKSTPESSRGYNIEFIQLFAADKDFRSVISDVDLLDTLAGGLQDIDQRLIRHWPHNPELISAARARISIKALISASKSTIVLDALYLDLIRENPSDFAPHAKLEKPKSKH